MAQYAHTHTTLLGCQRDEGAKRHILLAHTPDPDPDQRVLFSPDEPKKNQPFLVQVQIENRVRARGFLFWFGLVWFSWFGLSGQSVVVSVRQRTGY